MELLAIALCSELLLLSQGAEMGYELWKTGERLQAERNIAQAPLPKTDPVYGQDGQLAEYWHLL